MTDVQLTWAQVEDAAVIGVRRHVRNLMEGRHDAHRLNGDAGVAVHVDGACGELAGSVGTGRDWTSCMDKTPGKKVPDIDGADVRQTRYPNGHLIVYRDDPDDRPIILAVGSWRHFRLVGWIRAGDAKQPQWWTPQMRGACYTVPQSALRPMDELP